MMPRLIANRASSFCTASSAIGYMTFPKEHRAKLHSRNPIQRLHGEIKRRTEVVGNFPNRGAINLLIGAILIGHSMNGLPSVHAT